MSNPRKDIHDKIWGVMRDQQVSEISKTASARKKHNLLREHLWEIIEKDQGRIGYIVNMILLGAIVLSLITLPIEFIAALKPYHNLAWTIEIITTMILTTEYFLRIYAAPQRTKYVFSGQGIIDFLSILPFYFSFLSVRFLPFIRLLRLLRIIKILHIRSIEETQEEIKNRSLLSHKVELLSGEKIEKIAMKHPLFFLVGLILPLSLGIAGVFVIIFWHFQVFALIGGALLFLFMIIFIYNAWLDYFYDVIYITNFRLIFQNKYLFGYSANQVEYRNITNIRPSHTSIWSSIFNFGKIVVETSADQGFIEDRGIRKHEGVAHFIQQKCYEYTQSERQRKEVSKS